jgi:hypothetical protein
MSKRKESAVSEIANAIVDLVERTGGPVTLARIEREIAGFKADDDVKRSWEWVIGEDQDENLIWDGMSEEGCSALRKILLERKVAMQPAPKLVYFVEGGCPKHQNWFPISLVPARMAKLDTGGVLIRGPQDVLDIATARARNEGLIGFRVPHPEQ